MYLKIIAMLLLLNQMLCQLRAAVPALLGAEQILFKSDAQFPHLAFPHAVYDPSKQEILVIYRRGAKHVGTNGLLHLARFSHSNEDLKLIEDFKLIEVAGLDPRDPTISLNILANGEKEWLISFFFYNYTTRLNQQYVIRAPQLTQDLLKQNNIQAQIILPQVAKSASSAPAFRDELRHLWLLPLYTITDIFTGASDVDMAYLQDGEHNTWEAIKVARGADHKRFFLEPAIAQSATGKWTALWRTSPMAEGPGGLGPMMWASSNDGKIWSAPQDTTFIAHHPRLNYDSTGKLWAGFRDLTLYNEKTHKAQIALWQLPSTQNTIVINASNKPHPSNWDRGYPSLIEVASTHEKQIFWVVYYVNDESAFEIRARKLELTR